MIAPVKGLIWLTVGLGVRHASIELGEVSRTYRTYRRKRRGIRSKSGVGRLAGCGKCWWGKPHPTRGGQVAGKFGVLKHTLREASLHRGLIKTPPALCGRRLPWR